MFSSNKKTAVAASVSAVDKSTIGTIIAKGISIEGGTLKGDGNVRIDGFFVGDITVKGHIMISDSGAVYGDIDTNSALIAGNFKGNIKAVETIHLASTAVVEGAVESKTVVMDEDAVFNGNCRMTTSVQLPSKDAVTASTGVEENFPQNTNHKSQQLPD